MTSIPNRRRFLSNGLALPLGLSLSGRPMAQAKPWPAKPIQLVVASPAGGGVDSTVRRLAEQLGPLVGGSAVVLNRPGAAGLLGAQVVSSAVPDGYTLGYIHAGHLIIEAMEGRLNILEDFAPITMISASQFCIAVHVDSPYKTLKDLLNAIQKSPGKLNYGAGGNGSPGHIAFEKLSNLAGGLNVVQIPFKGAVEAVLAVAQKEIDFVCGLFSSVLSIARSGKVRILAVTGQERSANFPDVPTVAEATGIKGYHYVSWGAVMGPAKLPRDRIAKLDTALRTVANSTEFKKFVSEQGGQTFVSASPAALSGYIKTDLSETVALMKKLGLRRV